MEPATRIERATCHRFGPEACLTDSYEGGQPPCTIPTKGTHPLRIPTARWFYHWLGSRLLSQPGAGDWNRTSDLRFTKPLLYQLSYAGFFGKKRPYPITGFS